jgi:hypothetical protein
MTYKVAIRHDGEVDILPSSKRVTKKNYKFVTTGFKTEEKAEAYARNLHFKIPLK